MDRIKMYYSNVDTKPLALLRHFVRYLGFYVEDVCDKNANVSNVESLADIYIISDAFVEDYSTQFDLDDAEQVKTIIIYMDGWKCEELQQVCSIVYSPDMDDGDFLREFCRHLLNLLSGRADLSRRLIGSVTNLDVSLNTFIELYTGYHILQMATFRRYFNARHDLFYYACQNYVDFIDEIQRIECRGDLLDYMFLFACYELDMICKVNSYALYREPATLQGECERLLMEYRNNEQLHILLADIDLRLNGVWKKAGNEYADIRLTDCAYAYLCQGNILQKYVRERKAAMEAYKNALNRKGDYYIAHFKLGECYREQREYIKAVNEYRKVLEILAPRHEKHVLSPVAIMYCYKAAVQLADMFKTVFNFLESSEYYSYYAEEIYEEIKYDKYFRCIWSDAKTCETYFPLIYSELKNQLAEYAPVQTKESN